MEFPLYRKYVNNKSYFKVLDDERFEELQFIGKRYMLHRFKAALLPDRYLLADLIHLSHEGIVPITEEQYEQAKVGCESMNG